MSETVLPQGNRKTPSLTRKALVLGTTLLTTLTSCGLFRAEYDASTKALDTCASGTPLSRKSGDSVVDDGQQLIDDTTDTIAELYNRTNAAGGNLEFEQFEGKRIDVDAPTFGFRTTTNHLELRIAQATGQTVDKVIFPMTDGKPKEVTLGALACTEDAIYPKQIIDYLDAGLEATEALSTEPR